MNATIFNAVDHTAIVVQRLNISQTLIELLIADAEREEMSIDILNLFTF